MTEKNSQNEAFYEEEVIFYQWLMSSQSQPIKYPLNEELWIIVCRLGLRHALESFLLDAEYQQWLHYRTSVQRQLGERFLEDDTCKNLHRSSDVQVEASRKHWNG